MIIIIIIIIIIIRRRRRRRRRRPNQNKIRTLRENETNEYLEADIIKQVKMEDKIKKRLRGVSSWFNG